MAEVIKHRADGVIEMNSTDAGPSTFSKAPVLSIIVTGSAAGIFQVRLNNTTFTIRLTAERLTEQIFIKMQVHEVELVAQPADGIAYIILDQAS